MKAIILILFLCSYIACEQGEGLNATKPANPKVDVDSSKPVSSSSRRSRSVVAQEIDDLEDELKELKKQRKDLSTRIEDKEDDLEEVEDELEDIKDRLRNNRQLDPAERQRLENERDSLQERRNTLQGEINSLKAQKTEAENARKRAESKLAEEQKKSKCLQDTLKYSVCDRTPEVRDALRLKFSNKACRDINYCELSTITELDLSARKGLYVESNPCNDWGLKKSDFKGLTNLRELDLSDNCLEKLQEKTSAGFFNELTNIKEIDLDDTGITRLPGDFFSRDIINSLRDGGVIVSSDFVYCSAPESPFKAKLSRQITGVARTDPHGPRFCY